VRSEKAANGRSLGLTMRRVELLPAADDDWSDANPTQLYRHFDESGILLYVGISLSTLTRLGQHEDNAHWFYRIKTVTIEYFKTRQAAEAAEDRAILAERPLHNIRRPREVYVNVNA
jgi:hypothetical protein